MTLSSFLDEVRGDVGWDSARIYPIDENPNEICAIAREHGLTARVDTSGKTSVIIEP